MQKNYFELRKEYEKALNKAIYLDNIIKDQEKDLLRNTFRNGLLAVFALGIDGYILNSDIPFGVYYGSYFIGCCVTLAPVQIDLIRLNRAEKNKTKLLKQLKNQQYK